MKKWLVGGTLVAVTLSVAHGFNAVQAENVTFSADIEYSLAMTLSDSAVALSINPLTTPFASGSMTATVATNNPYGYIVGVSSNENETNLTRTEAVGNETPVIATLESQASENNFETNRWGYRIGTSGDYLPFDGNIELDDYNQPTNGRTATLGFAAKADYTQPAGTYNIELSIASVIKIVTPDTGIDMQGVNQTVLDGLTTGDVVTMRDARNGREYEVSVFEFGGDKMLWMNDNLKLEPGTTLHPYDSNVSENFTLSTEQWVDSGQDYYCKQAMAVVDTDDDGVNDQYYYNYFAATANPNDDYSTMYWNSVTNEYDIPADDPVSPSCATVSKFELSLGDICPKGWRLPTQSDLTSVAMRQAIFPTLSFSGAIYGGELRYFGSAGGWWTSTLDETLMYDQAFTAAYSIINYMGELMAGAEDNQSSIDQGAGLRCLYFYGELPANEEEEDGE